MKNGLIIMLMILVLGFGCTERIDIDLDETYTRLVIYGALTTDTATQYIELTKTTSYYYDAAPPPVSDAIVEISDNEGNIIILSETASGKYATPSYFYGIPGRTYKLTIELAEAINNHKSYEASSTVTPINTIDSIRLQFQPDWGLEGFYEVQCFYQDPPSREFYMFNISKNSFLLTDTITERFVSDDLFYNGSYTNGIGVGYLDQSNPEEKLNPGDTITFQGCSISEDYYNFIVNLQQEAGFQNPLFGGPPANVKGNISNGAIGFFAVYSVAYAETVFQP
jgi:hypothetical protein